MNPAEENPQWVEALGFAKKQIAPADSIFATDMLLHRLPDALPYAFMSVEAVKKCAWLIVHKNATSYFTPRIVRVVKRRFKAVFANEVFVILMNKDLAAREGLVDLRLPPADRVHEDALWSILESPRAGPQIFAHSRPWTAQWVKANLIDVWLLPPRTLVVNAAVHGGFFSNFNRVLNHLVHSLGRDGISSVQAEWNAVETLDAEGKVTSNSFPYGRPADGNLWDCFFEPVSPPPAAGSRIERTAYFVDPRVTGVNVHFLYKSGSEWRRQYHAAFQKHIRVRPHLREKVERFHAQHLAGRYCIGVHLRNDAHKTECFSGKPTTFEHYVGKIRELMAARGGKCAIMLATDVEVLAERLRAIFGDAVCVQPGVERLTDLPSGETDHQLHHNNTNPGVKLGEDILIDCLLLAKCDALIHTASNVATAAGYMNPAMEMIYFE